MQSYWKNFFILYSVQFMQLLDFMSISPLGALFVRQNHIDSKTISFSLTAYSIAAIISSFIVARHGRQQPKSTLFGLVAIFSLSQLVLIFPISATLFIAAKVIGGFTGGLMGSIAYSQISNIEDGQRTGLWNGRIQTAQSIATIAGIPFCLMMVSSFGSSAYFIFMTLWSWLTLFMFSKANFMKPAASQTSELNWGFASRNLDVVISGFVVYFASFLFIAQLANYLLNVEALSPEQLSLSYTISGVLTLITSGTIGSLGEKFPATRLLILTLFLICLPQLAFFSVGAPLILAFAAVPAYLLISNARAIYQRSLILQKGSGESFLLHLLNNIVVRTGILSSGVVLGFMGNSMDVEELFFTANKLSMMLNLALAIGLAARFMKRPKASQSH